MADAATIAHPLDLNDVIQEVVALTQGELRSNGIALRLALASEPPIVVGDRVQLQQVMLNLILNAIEAMSGAADGLRSLTIQAVLDSGKDVHVEMRDTGVGFDASVSEAIFEAFYTTKAAGMGMGLSISRSIGESHEGRLWATLNDVAGTTFHFTLPLRQSTKALISQK